jgi:8-oxo-dGTP pyrophosphatase MutT (NUDIX family)
VLVHRGDQWLLGVRAPGVAYAPGILALIGGHLEPGDADLEATARRELAEETGTDLGDTPLRYLESELLGPDAGAQLTVTFIAAAPPDADPVVRQPAELTEVGWWTLPALESDPRCPPWLPPLIRRAASLVGPVPR